MHTGPDRRQRTEQVNEIPPAYPAQRVFPLRWRKLAVAATISISVAFSGASALGAPGSSSHGPAVATWQNVDYISAESGAALDLGFPVLVPSWVPSPFGGEPAISASGGYYSLYWMNGGGEPTFLQVEGTVGGGLPAGSPYDLNNQLFINASVQGYDAIHDVTPAYDAVWWIAGGVLYKVESRNSGTDSLSLANSLITFAAPSAPEPEPTDPPVEEPVPTDPPVVNDPEPTSPPVVDEPEQPVDAGGDTGDGTTTQPDGPETQPDDSTSDLNQGPVDVEGEAGDDTLLVTDASTESNEDGTGGSDGTESPQTPTVNSDGTGGAFVSSDGTGGASVRVFGADGTGGTNDIVVLPASTREPVP